MGNKADIISGVDDFFSGNYVITDGTTIPDVADINLGKCGRSLELAMLFIDIKESTAIVDSTRRLTAARMYKSFLWGVTRIAKLNSGEVRSFNGDGVLVAFIGDSKRTNATKAALQMAWFVSKVVKPKMDKYYESNQALQGSEFDCGIGIDVGDVLVVRGGIRGENNNDLVWVGNATNYAVKLSELSEGIHRIFISEDVYKYMHRSSKFGGSPEQNMWQARSWTAMDGATVYRSSWTWAVSD